MTRERVWISSSAISDFSSHTSSLNSKSTSWKLCIFHCIELFTIILALHIGTSISLLVKTSATMTMNNYHLNYRNWLHLYVGDADNIQDPEVHCEPCQWHTPPRSHDHRQSRHKLHDGETLRHTSNDHICKCNNFNLRFHLIISYLENLKCWKGFVFDVVPINWAWQTLPFSDLGFQNTKKILISWYIQCKAPGHVLTLIYLCSPWKIYFFQFSEPSSPPLCVGDWRCWQPRD